MDTLQLRDGTVGLVIETGRLGLFIWGKNHELVEHTWHVCDQLEIHNLVIFNPTRVIKLIRDFLARSVLHDCRTIIALDAPCLDEHLMNMPEVTEQQGYISSVHQLSQNCWYKVNIPYALRAQYHLLALMVPFQLVRITTVTLAYYSLLSLERKVIPEPAYSSLESLKDTLYSGYTQSTIPAYAHGLYALAHE